MSLDFIAHKFYSIDFKKLYEVLDSNRIFEDKNLQKLYLRRWVEVLQGDVDILRKQSKDPEILKQILKASYTEPEIFQFPITYGTEKILIHFRTSIICKMIEGYKDMSIEISTSEFFDNNSNIHWNPVDSQLIDKHESTIKERLLNNDPVILVPFYNGHKSFLLIDGNHRVTYSDRKGIPFVKTITIAEESLIENELFASSFDKNIYILHNELAHLMNLTHMGNMSSIEIAKKSILSDGVFKFRVNQ